MASPEHQRLVAALSAVGMVLTPTTAPSSRELRELRESEASADIVIPDGTTVVPCRYGAVDCFRLDVGQHRNSGTVTRPASAVAPPRSSMGPLNSRGRKPASIMCIRACPTEIWR